MSDPSFEKWFAAITGHESPLAWQSELATQSFCSDRLIQIPTGLGKTQGILAAWSYHRIHRLDDQWPRRLVWCLPMRVLVEQTVQIAREMAQQIEESSRPAVHAIMGGEDGSEWFLYPERPAIIIGTQDMLLSRALNRGFAGSRARWPMEFGLLNQDAVWVMDEVQLMDVGLATSAQLQAFREQDRVKRLRPCHTWWMSATLQPDWLRSVDTAAFHSTWTNNPCKVASAHQKGGLWEISKVAATIEIPPDDHKGFADRILEEHNKLIEGEWGKITLVVCNTVDRACDTYRAIKEARGTEGLELVHSRFRPCERKRWRETFLEKKFCKRGTDRIIVATQVVEAGVDIAAGCLITELAPWPSLVQRFGRCARYGGSGSVLVVDRGHDQKQAAPYEAEELESAWQVIQHLKDVGITALEKHQGSLSPEDRKKLYPYSPAHLLLRKEFDDLFDTTPDLTGADVDISRFIRSGDERDLQVFWLEIAKEKKGEPRRRPPDEYQPNREELCPVPFLKARDWLCGTETSDNRKPRLRGKIRAWIWDWIEGEWKVAARESLMPGRIVCVSSDSGGYQEHFGFKPDSSASVPPVNPSEIPKQCLALGAAENQQNKELSADCWKTIGCHTSEVVHEAVEITKQLGLSRELQDIIELAAMWHDWGKAHQAFQGSMRERDGISRPNRTDLAKAPDKCWSKKYMYRFLDDSETRPAFRHELASALGLFSILHDYAPQHPALLGPWSEVFSMLGKPIARRELPTVPSPLVHRVIGCSAETFNLLVYLVASHHGKVRVALHAAPKDQDYVDRDGRGLPIRGVREADRLPTVVLIPGEPPVPEVTLTLAPAALGLSDKTGISWRERSLGLAEIYGPGGLAFLEAILRSADVRASQLATSDPVLPLEANA